MIISPWDRVTHRAPTRTVCMLVYVCLCMYACLCILVYVCLYMFDWLLGFYDY